MKKTIQFSSLLLALAMMVSLCTPAVFAAGNAAALTENIAATYTNADEVWQVIDINAYAVANPGHAELTQAATDAYVNSAIRIAAASSATNADLAKVILGLASCGIDPTDLTLAGASKINAVEKMTAVGWTASTYFIYTAPYMLLAYQQGSWGTDTQEQALVNYLLAEQKADGSWDTSFGYDTMGMVLQSLAAYYGENAAVTTAVDNAVAYLRAHVGSDGLYPNSYDAAYSTAEVILGLCACGVDPATVKNASGKSLVDGILSAANAANTAFQYSGSDNAGTTERCFRALIAQQKIAAGEHAWDVYDFTSLSKKATALSDWAHCPVTAALTPSGATIEIKNSAGTVLVPTLAEVYDLPAGTYTYTAAMSGSGSTTGTFTISSAEGAQHTAKSLVVSFGTGGTGSSSGSGTAKPQQGTTTNAGYTDVTDSDWCAGAVEYVTNAGWMNGVTGTTFAPKDSLTRAMFATILYRMNKSPEVGGMVLREFDDCEAIPAWAYDGMLWSVDSGIFKGVGGNNLAPNQALTRQQAATLLYRQQGAPEVGGMVLHEFSDEGKIALWAHDAMLWAVSNGILSGDGNGALNPDGVITRAETAALLQRVATAK